MISLFIDTSYFNIAIGIYEDLKPLYFKSEKNDNQLSIRLLPMIEKAFEETKINIHDVDKIFAVVGPGSFTGIRIGVATAKTIGWALKKKVIPISELEVLATTSSNKKYIIPMIDARRGYVFGAMFDKNLKSIIKDQYISVENFMEKIKKKTSIEEVEFITFDEFQNQKLLIPKIDIVKIIEKHYEDEGIKADELNPNYLKKTEAEEKKNRG